MTSTDRRGAEIFAIELEQVLARKTWSISTLALAPGESGGLDLATLGATPLGRRTLMGLRAAAQDAEIVVAHGSSTLPACALALGRHTPFVYRNIGDPEHWSSSPARRARTSLFLWRAAAVAALSPGAASVLRSRYRVGTTKIAVIPTGVSSTRYRPAHGEERSRARADLGLDPGARVAAVVGALSPEKAVEVAVRAAALAPEIDVLLIAGDGPDRPALETLAAKVAPGRVRFLGSMPDVTRPYAAADVVLLPSDTEGLPAALIEAGLSGLPTVATDVGFVRDIVIDGETGVVVPQADPEALGRATQRVLQNPGSMGDRARAHCLAHFDLEVVAEQWANLFGTVLDQRR